jgi:cell division septum initiation protein DivIVA
MTGTGTELLAQIVEERTRLLAENERLRAENADLAERVSGLEAEKTVLRRTLDRWR